jgi:hypothetical protein
MTMDPTTLGKGLSFWTNIVQIIAEKGLLKDSIEATESRIDATKRLDSSIEDMLNNLTVLSTILTDLKSSYNHNDIYTKCGSIGVPQNSPWAIQI